MGSWDPPESCANHWHGWDLKLQLGAFHTHAVRALKAKGLAKASLFPLQDNRGEQIKAEAAKYPASAERQSSLGHANCAANERSKHTI